MESYKSKRLGIYVHIPFCRSKCAYCDFYSFPPKDDGFEEKYVDALISHMEAYRDAARDYYVDSVYIGGGTPTILPPELLVKLLRAVKKNFNVTDSAEISCECNPATADYRYFRRMRRAGFNRLSIGLQSADDAELKRLGRIHTRRDFYECYRAARQAKFRNINIDIMYGLPSQSEKHFLRTLQYVMRLAPEHISMYGLKIEPATPFGKAASSLDLPSDDVQADTYLDAVELMRHNGYLQYEISNFARRGYIARHNLKYWNCEEYLGFGAAAHSFFRGNRFSFIRSAAKYVSALQSDGDDIMLSRDSESLTFRDSIGEYIMLRLRLTAGISASEFKRRFGEDFDSSYGSSLDKYVSGGYVTHRGDRYALTPKGMLVSNYILTEILDFSPDGSFIYTGDGAR